MAVILFGIQSFRLQNEEKAWLRHPNSAGIVLFARNYQNRVQLSALCAEIRDLAPEKLLAVDHEGGRVQRFREGFTRLPAMRRIGEHYEQNQREGLELAEAVGCIIGSELAEFDLSLSPVLDLYAPQSRVIADRAFAADAASVSALARALRRGMRGAGMAAVGKHYPGHGRIEADSHVEICRDERPEAAREEDRRPFLEQIADGLEALMPAHIIYPESEGLPAGFSAPMLQALRRLGFQGAILSDDLDMAAAQIAPGHGQRVQQALTAGVDACLLCNDAAAIREALHYDYVPQPESASRLRALKRRRVPDAAAYAQALATFQAWEAQHGQ